MSRVLGSDPAVVSLPGTMITQYFAPLHELVQGSPPLIDLTLQKFAVLQNVLNQSGVTSGPSALQPVNQQMAASNDLAAHAKTLPPMLAGIVADPTATTTKAIKSNINSDFLQRYRQVVSECKDLAQGRYPLTSSNTDMTLTDFAKLFGPNGTFDAFFRNTLQSFIDISGATWRWKPEARALGGAGIPRQFQRAKLIKDVFFPAAGDPKVLFAVTTESADDNVNRATLTIDGQRYEFRNGATTVPVKMRWPGPESGRAEFTMDISGILTKNSEATGAWAMFRLFGNLQPKGGDKFTASFLLGGRTVRLLITASGARNPFGSNPLQGFNCQG
jgi:type VI secretion system protein ImpL